MGNSQWNSPEQLRALLCELVSWDSRTGTDGEIKFAHYLKDKLLELPYFQKNNSYLQLLDAEQERNAVTAFYHSRVTNETIVLISHFDTVHTEEFGELGNLAFQPEKLTEALKEQMESFPQDVQLDLESDEYLFGRGTMDMKMGLVLHMYLLEMAITEGWPINLLLLTVPDEEVNSSGMRAAVKGLTQLREKYNLSYKLFLNSEPCFSQNPLDNNYYIYSGTIGKIMPSALFYGVGRHAGEPFNGITSHYMASYLTQAMEFNEDFVEEVFGEETPLPVCLQSNDLKEDYSTQTSHHSYALYNVFVMKRDTKEVMEIFEYTAKKAMEKCQKDYLDVCVRKGIAPIGKIKVLKYEQLVNYAKSKLGRDTVNEIIEKITKNKSLNERTMSIQICDLLMLHCLELAPATILFFAPPYYPAVNSTESNLIQEKIALTKKVLLEKFNIEAKQIHYFNGISDLSYVNYNGLNDEWKTYQKNTPVWGEVYNIPFNEMKTLQSPVINVGPFGKDAHRLSERLHKNSAFVYTPHILKEIITSLFPLKIGV